MTACFCRLTVDLKLGDCECDTRVGLTADSRTAGLNDDTGHYEWQPKGLRVFQVTSPDPASDVAAVQQGKISITPLRTAFVAGG